MPPAAEAMMAGFRPPATRTDRSWSVRVPRDAQVGGAVLVFCALAYAVTLGFDEAPAALAQNVQPATFPRLVLGVMAVLAAILVVRGFLTEPREPSPVPAMVPVSALVMIGFVVAFDQLGILAAMVLLCLGLPRLWGERRWHLILPFALALPAAVYLVFGVLLGVYFEPGVLAWLL